MSFRPIFAMVRIERFFKIINFSGNSSSRGGGVLESTFDILMFQTVPLCVLFSVVLIGGD